LRAVYTPTSEGAPGAEAVIYQLEDTGHPVLRLRPSVWQVDDGGLRRYLYRVDAFSRLTGARLGRAEVLAELDSAAEFAARSRKFQSEPFRRVVDDLSAPLIERFADREATGAVQR
jgi:hypothetical protein